MSKVSLYITLGVIDELLCYGCIGQYAHKEGRVPLYTTVHGAEMRARAREAARLGLNKFDIITDESVKVFVTLTKEQAETAILNLQDYLGSEELAYYASKNSLYITTRKNLERLVQRLTNLVAKC